MNRYRIVTFVDNDFIVNEFTTHQLIPALEVRGFSFMGYTNNPSVREELRVQPKFKGLLGPMWDGDAIRYESPAAYEILSN